MKVIKVDLKERRYDVIVGENILRNFGKSLKRLDMGRDAIFITNPTINKYWGKRVGQILKAEGFKTNFIEVPDTEKSKSAGGAFRLLNQIAEYGKSRKLFITAFGGGVVGDLGGFVASVYKRGVPFVQLPTTLVAQVDSAIGGKVAIDLAVGKNLIGSFYQPRIVFSETEFLSTLSRKQIRNGLSESIKYGVIKDNALFEFIDRNVKRALMADLKTLEFIVCRASQIKAKIVERDEFDNKGSRAILNYGHTIGHAIEAAAGYSKRYAHGMAISAGMAAANFISNKMGLLTSAESQRIGMLLEKAGLPTKVKGVLAKEIYGAHLYDKKFIGRKNRFVLPVKIGEAKIFEDIPERFVREAIGLICGR